MGLEFVFAGVLLLVLGCLAGFLAGLLGIGGGAVLVPGLYYLLLHFGYEAHAMHIAVGTWLTTIVFTGMSSGFAHYKKGAVDTDLLRQFLVGVVAGVAIGTYLADVFDTDTMKIIFAGSQLFFGGYMIWRGNKDSLLKSMPRQPFTSIIAACNAALATLMGVGGGVQNVVFMTLCGVPIHRAIATAAAIGPLIALIGAAGFVYIGWDESGLPPLSLGYLNLAAFGCIIASSVLFAPLGVRVAHALPVPKLKRVFAVFMLCIAAKMIFS